ncbi:TetR/AcrR family transcriptional regulator [Mycobacterium heidelbergense]|uniref:TetR/AcrR family transcriptional regulator n=1 Tax=Mycobacterium heidelbergense TaxID=53376 RepID=UPI003CF441CE
MTSRPDTDSAVIVQRDRIRDAARAVIEEHGPDALTSQIAKRAGLARPNVYRHFASKDDLDLAVAVSAYEELRAEIRTRLDHCDTPLDVIRAPIATQVTWAQGHQNLYRFLVSRGHLCSAQRTPKRSDFAAELAAAGARYFPHIADDPDAAEGIVVALIGLVDACVLRWLGRPVETPERLIDDLTAHAWLIVDHHLRGFGVSPDPLSPLARGQQVDRL